MKSRIVPSHLRSLVAVLALAASALVGGCGGGGGGGSVAAAPDPATLPLMVDSLGRQVPEAEFGGGDTGAAGADGVVVDGGPVAHTDVILTDNAGNTRATTTDASGYYRMSIKGLTPPFVLKARRFGVGNWFSASMEAPKARGFVTINVNGLSDKLLGYVADAEHFTGGSSGAVTPAVLAGNGGALAAARTRLRTGLGIPLLNAGLDPALYDPISTAFQPVADDRHVAFLGSLGIRKTGLGGPVDAGRNVVVGTIAGAGGYTINGPAAAASFSVPSGVAVDAGGNLFVADSNNSLIRKVTPAGAVSTFAGNGVAGYINGSPQAAAFNFPQGLALDRSGNLYVADTGNHVVRKLDAAGNVTVLAGGGVAGFADGIGTTAKFSSPKAVAVDAAGNVYVADYGNRALRKITADGVVTTIAGSIAYGAPRAVAVGPDDSVYVTHGSTTATGGESITRITPAGVSSLLTSTGFFGEANRWYPEALAVDSTGSVYAADSATHRIMKVAADGTTTVLAGAPGYPWFAGFSDAPGASARFSGPVGIAVDTNGNVFVADAGNNAIRKIAATGQVSTVAGKSAGFADGTGPTALFDHPDGVTVDAGGNILVADTGNHAIRRISRTGTVTTVAGNGTAGFANRNGRSAIFNAPTGVAADGIGNIYVAGNSNVIRKISPAGDVTTFAGSGAAGFADGPALQASFNAPAYLAADRNGNVYVSDTGNALIRKISAAGVVSTAYGTPPAQVGAFRELNVGVIAMHPGDIVYFEAKCLTVPQTNCIFTIAVGGVISQFAPQDILYRRAGLAVDSRSDVYSVYAASFPQQLPAPVRNTVFKLTAGKQEGEAASDPRFNRPRGIAVDVNGNIVLADSGNSAIRIVLP